MKNVIIITQNFPPELIGRASRILEMATNLQKFHKVTIISPPPTFPFTKYEKAKYLYRNEKINDIEVVRLWTFQPSKIKPSAFQRVLYYLIFPVISSIFLITKLPKISSIIVSTPPPSLLLVTLLARLFRKRIIIDVGDLWFDPNSSREIGRKHLFLRKLMKKFEISCWKKSDLVIANSRIVHDVISRTLDYKQTSSVTFFPYTVDVNTFKKHNVTPDNQIVYIGSFSFAYDFQSLLEAMPIVLQNIPNLKIQFYGAGDGEPQLRKLVKDMNLEKSCIINSFITREEIPLILSRSLVGIIPLTMHESLRYVMPTKTFEYLACGLPIFAYGSSDELEKILKESGAGIYINSNDRERISTELVKMLSDKDALEVFSRNGRQYAEKNSDYAHLSRLI